MTIYSSLARLPARLPLRRERWELPDSDFVDVDRLEGSRPDSPLVIVLHGLEGEPTSGYVHGLLGQLHARGLAGAALAFRGCSGTPNRLALSYHSGDTRDLRTAVARLVAERPGRALGICGFSLGGNVTAKFFAEEGAQLAAEVRGGVAISPPFDLAACAAALDGPGLFAAIYRTRFLRSLRAKAAQKAVAFPGAFPGAFDGARARSAKTFREFDDAVTAPLAGFRDADEYWARSSAGPLLGAVRRPLHVIVSDDDPFIPPWDFAHSPSVMIERYARGGHVAFVEGPPWAPRRYAERRAAEVLAGWLTNDSFHQAS